MSEGLDRSEGILHEYEFSERAMPAGQTVSCEFGKQGVQITQCRGKVPPLFQISELYGIKVGLGLSVPIPLMTL
jgi:hypothetical protein